MYGEPTVGLRASHQGAVMQGGSLAHADQAVPGLAGRATGYAIVDHRQVQFARFGGDTDGAPGWCCRMFDDVGQRLLHDSVRGELDRRG
jgi:hypothetical protein